ncbi:B12-binding domain-containing protein [uncultured Enterovirga sp.]|uniref:cobalamin B12-binding domain-containing protein n=1 Tax=uncultured Enterovirga sp. TaxID=2026352 RepID=UPI0035C9E6A3
MRSGVTWGPAEQEALDRCLSVPGLSARLEAREAPRRLSRMIETEIIPRLLLTHIAEPEEGTVPQPALTPADVRDFTRIVLEDEVAGVLSYAGAIREAGHSLEDVFLHLLGPTARLLGDMWAADLCSFTDVTIGLSRLQQVLRDLSPSFEDEDRLHVRGRILLASVPGEQHSFGLSMLESFFRRAGWDVSGGGAHDRNELLRLAREERFDAIGLSLSSDVLYEPVRALIPALRAASKNRSVLMMVGGRYFVDHPDHATLIGADVAASDAPDALRRADACLGFDLARC